MDHPTVGLKQVSGARQANRVRCVTFGAYCAWVEHVSLFFDIGNQRIWEGAHCRLWVTIKRLPSRRVWAYPLRLTDFSRRETLSGEEGGGIAVVSEAKARPV